jgi:hypothetical protein
VACPWPVGGWLVRRVRGRTSKYERTQMMMPSSPWSPSTIVNDTMPPRDPNDDDDEEEDQEDEDRDDEPPVVREPEPDE